MISHIGQDMHDSGGTLTRTHEGKPGPSRLLCHLHTDKAHLSKGPPLP